MRGRGRRRMRVGAMNQRRATIGCSRLLRRPLSVHLDLFAVAELVPVALRTAPRFKSAQLQKQPKQKKIAAAAPRRSQREHPSVHLLVQLEVAGGEESVAAPLAGHVRTAGGVRPVTTR